MVWCGSGISGRTPRRPLRRSSSSTPTTAGRRWHRKAERRLLDRVALALHARGEGLVVSRLLLRDRGLRLLFGRGLLLLLLRSGLFLGIALRGAAGDYTRCGA